MARDIEQLFAAYSDSLGSCRKAPRSRSISPYWFLSPALFAAVVFGFNEFRESLPSPAMRAYDQMLDALSAKTQYGVTRQAFQAGDWKTLMYGFFENGKEMLHFPKDRPKSGWRLIENGRMTATYDGFDYRVVSREDPSGIADESGAKSFFENSVPYNTVSGDTWEEVPNANPYFTVLTLRHGKGDSSAPFCKLWIDPETHLPSQMEIWQESDLPNWAKQPFGVYPRPVHYDRIMFDFHTPIQPKRFILDGNDPVYDCSVEQSRLRKKWEPGVPVNGARYCDACQTSDGTVWIVSRGMDSSPKHPYPITVDLSLPLKVVRGGPFDSSDLGFKSGQSNVEVDPFFSASGKPIGKLDSVTVVYHFAKSEGGDVPFKVQVRQEDRLVPSYLLALDLEAEAALMVANRNLAMAAAAEQAHDYARAAEFYEAVGSSILYRMSIAGHVPFLEASQDRAKAGQKEQSQADLDRLGRLLHLSSVRPSD